MYLTPLNCKLKLVKIVFKMKEKKTKLLIENGPRSNSGKQKIHETKYISINTFKNV